MDRVMDRWGARTTARASRVEAVGGGIGLGRVAGASLAALWLVTAAGVIGFALFGVNPELLSRYPDAVPIYAAMYRWMPIGQVVLAFAVMVVLLRVAIGWSWLVGFGAVYATSLASELIGTTWGVPFGEYGYRAGLGPMWLDRVPFVIPLSWFYMAIASYALVRAAQRPGVPFGPDRVGWSRLILAAALLTAWDLSLDPAMSAATSFWWWGESGPYYGMPLLNVLGWFVTSLLLMAALRLAGADRWLAGVPTTWMASFYGANLFLAMGMAAGAGMWGALLATTVAIVGVLALARRSVAGAP